MWNEIAEFIHDNAVAKGFWPPQGRNFGEMIALAHSELSEAWEYDTLKDDGLDDHLPTWNGYDVEIADAVIRVLDTGRFLGVDFDGHLINHDPMFDYTYGVDLSRLHWILSNALEANRKGRVDDTRLWLGEFLAAALTMAEMNEIDLPGAIEAKMEYNTTRPYKHGKAY